MQARTTRLARLLLVVLTAGYVAVAQPAENLEEPRPFWANQLSGRFTKAEIFNICARIGFENAMSWYSVRSKRPARKVGLDLFLAGNPEKYSELRAREPQVFGKVLEYAARSFDRASDPNANDAAHL